MSAFAARTNFRQWMGDNRARFFRWSSLLIGFAAVQAFAQLLSALTGFVLVRHLTKEEYAWFTIASGMTAGLSILADSGIGSAVTSLAGGVWQDGRRFAALIAAALKARARSGILAASLIVPTTAYMLWRNAAPLAVTLGVTLLVVLPLGWSTKISILTVVNRMHHRTRQIQMAEITAASARAAFTIIPTVLGHGSALIAMLAMSVTHWVQSRMVARQVAPLLSPDLEQSDADGFALRIRRVMGEMLPSCVFVAFQGQISVLLISLFASSSQVADLGALSRLGILFTVAGAPLAQLVPPRVAKCQEPGQLRRMLSLVAGGYGLFVLAVLALIYFRSAWFLWLLGPAYAHLEHELMLVAVSMGLGGMNATMWSMNFARGWTRHAWLNIPVTLAMQIMGVLLFQIDTVAGVAQLGIAVVSGHLLHSGAIAITGLRSFYKPDVGPAISE
jgi:O-antigen/teichoic acid export membrane protein